MASSLVEYAAARIHETFDVSWDEARNRGEGLVGLIEAKGGTPHEALIDDLVEPHFWRELTWRDPAGKERYLENRRKRAAAYNEYIDRGRKEWWKKWK